MKKIWNLFVLGLLQMFPHFLETLLLLKGSSQHHHYYYYLVVILPYMFATNESLSFLSNLIKHY